MALRMAARSTTAGTPVKSCMSTRAGLNGISTCCLLVFTQSTIFSTSASVQWKPSALRTADSSNTLIEYGS